MIWPLAESGVFSLTQAPTRYAGAVGVGERSDGLLLMAMVLTVPGVVVNPKQAFKPSARARPSMVIWSSRRLDGTVMALSPRRRIAREAMLVSLVCTLQNSVSYLLTRSGSYMASSQVGGMRKYDLERDHKPGTELSYVPPQQKHGQSSGLQGYAVGRVAGHAGRAA